MFTATATTTHAQTLYGTITGTVTDAQGSHVPGATVTARNEQTGLEVSSISDETGTYTIRNIPGGNYSLKASLQGFKEFVQTGVPVVVGNIVRINAALEVGALSETVTVTTEAALLKTDKADVSTDLRPEDIVNLPLNQYRNYQTLLNLVPGRDAADLPERADRHAGPRAEHEHQRHQPQQQRDAHRRRGQHQRLAAAPRRLRRPGRDHRERQHLDQQLRRVAGHDRRRGDRRPDQVRARTSIRGSAFVFRQQDEWNARRGFFDPAKLDAAVTIGGGTVGGPVKRNKLFYFVGWERNNERNSRFNQYSVPTAKMRQGDFSEVLAVVPELPPLRSGDR